MPTDAAGYALALDALNNKGVGSLTRVKPQALKTCLSVAAPNMSLTVAVQLGALLDDLIKGYL